MDLWTTVSVLILGVVEGLTEFLPISSTGHQIIVADLLDFGGERAMAFNIIIQLGAILAVVWEFRRKIFDIVRGLPTQRRAQQFTLNLLIGFLPAVILGVLFADKIHHYLFNPITVAVALVVGGVIMLWAERRDHVVYVDQRIEGLQLPYEAVAQDIRRELYQRVWQKSVAQYLQTLVGAADIQGIQLAGADSPLLQ